MKLRFGKKAAGEAESGLAVKAKPKKKKGRWKKRAVALMLALALAGGGGWWYLSRQSGAAQAEDASIYTEVSVERRDITSTITGSGTLEAANTYSVTSLVEGTILTAGCTPSTPLTRKAPWSRPRFRWTRPSATMTPCWRSGTTSRCVPPSPGR